MSVVIQHAEELSPHIRLSESAIKHLLVYLDKNEGNRGVRLSVKKTGCSGLSYVVDYVSEPKDTDLMMPLAQEYALWIDRKSYPFLKDMDVDYVQQGLNFKFVFNNPNQTGQCGCGESFTVDGNAGIE
jgi:iron-sulfur cluster assembly protein